MKVGDIWWLLVTSLGLQIFFLQRSSPGYALLGILLTGLGLLTLFAKQRAVKASGALLSALVLLLLVAATRNAPAASRMGETASPPCF